MTRRLLCLLLRMSVSMDEIGPLLRLLRQDSGMLLREVADRVGITESMLCHIELGNRRPSWPRLQQILKVFGCEAVIIIKERSK